MIHNQLWFPYSSLFTSGFGRLAVTKSVWTASFVCFCVEGHAGSTPPAPPGASLPGSKGLQGAEGEKSLPGLSGEHTTF